MPESADETNFKIKLLRQIYNLNKSDLSSIQADRKSYETSISIQIELSRIVDTLNGLEGGLWILKDQASLSISTKVEEIQTFFILMEVYGIYDPQAGHVRSRMKAKAQIKETLTQLEKSIKVLKA